VSPKNTHYLSVNSELNNIFKKRKVPSPSSPSINISDDKFNPYSQRDTKVNNKQNNKNKLYFSLIIIPDGTETPKIPRK